MPASIARRGFLAAPLLALPAFADNAAGQLAELERRNGGRLGVAALDTASGRRVGHRLDTSPAVQHLQVPGRGLRPGAGRSRRGKARSPRRLLRQGPSSPIRR